jgi:hypothetical protein
VKTVIVVTIQHKQQVILLEEFPNCTAGDHVNYDDSIIRQGACDSAIVCRSLHHLSWKPVECSRRIGKVDSFETVLPFIGFN